MHPSFRMIRRLCILLRARLYAYHSCLFARLLLGFHCLNGSNNIIRGEFLERFFGVRVLLLSILAKDDNSSFGDTFANQVSFKLFVRNTLASVADPEDALKDPDGVPSFQGELAATERLVELEVGIPVERKGIFLAEIYQSFIINARFLDSSEELKAFERRICREFGQFLAFLSAEHSPRSANDIANGPMFSKVRLNHVAAVDTVRFCHAVTVTINGDREHCGGLQIEGLERVRKIHTL
jgi:hypothetical protein